MNWPSTTVVVTGATKGIGRALTEALLAKGASVGAIARSEADLEALSETVGKASDAGGNPKARMATAPADVSSREELDTALRSLAEELGQPDVLVNNAGIGLYGPVSSLDPGAAEKLMRVNYLGTLYATQAVLPAMIRRRKGHIVNVASIAGRIGAPFEAAYAASKFAVVGFTEALAVEVARLGVKVSMVNPGPVETSFFEARGHPYERKTPRPVSAEAVARAVIETIESGRIERIVPRSLGKAVILRHLVPNLFELGTRVAFRRETERYLRQIEAGGELAPPVAPPGA
jgi:short-subunit dehydrogenase